MKLRGPGWAPLAAVVGSLVGASTLGASPPAALAATTTSTQVTTGAGTEALRGERELGSYLDRLAAAGHFDGVVLVSRGEQVLARRAFGRADEDSGRAMTPTTGFDIGSVAKQFTAAAVLAAQQQRLLSVDDPLGRHLPGVSQDKRTITLHQLLTHSAGLGEDHSAGDQERLDRGQALERILSTPLLHPPGDRYAYSNSGYTLLAAVLEQATGQPFTTYLRTTTLDPAGMTATGFVGEARFRHRDVATGYANGQAWGSPATWTLEWGVVGNGGMISTVDDLHRWQQSWRTGAVLPAQVVRTAFTAHVSEGDDGTAYGYGWSLGPSPLGQRVGHNGGGIGGNSYLATYPDHDLAVIVLGNHIDLRYLAAVPVAADLPADQLQAAITEGLATGRYDLPSPLLAAWIAPALAATLLTLGTSATLLTIALVRRRRRRRTTSPGPTPGPATA